jgi:hypothetical protein
MHQAEMGMTGIAKDVSVSNKPPQIQPQLLFMQQPALFDGHVNVNAPVQRGMGGYDCSFAGSPINRVLIETVWLRIAKFSARDYLDIAGRCAAKVLDLVRNEGHGFRYVIGACGVDQYILAISTLFSAAFAVRSDTRTAMSAIAI